MKKTIYSIMLCLAFAASGMLSSCSEDMPNVNFVNVVTNSADFRKVIDKIQTQGLTLAEKLDLVNETIDETNYTLDEKLELIQVAVDNGVATYAELTKQLIKSIDNLNATQDAKLKAIYDILESNSAALDAKLASIDAAIEKGIGTYEEYAAKLVESINKMAATQDEKLKAIYDILESNNASLAQKLADIEAAINAGIGTYEEYAKKLIASINALNLSQAEKLQAIHDILNSGFASLSQKVADVAAAIEDGFLSNKDAIEALNKAIVATLADNSRDLNAKLADIETAIKAIKTSIDNGFTFEKAALVELGNAVLGAIEDNATSETAKLYALAVAIDALSGSVSGGNEILLTLLNELKAAIEARTDYSGIIEAIYSLLTNGHAFVNLGLPSGTLWATCNLGAEKPEEYGNYYGFGMTEPYKESEDIDWNTYFIKLGADPNYTYYYTDINTIADPLLEFIKGYSRFSQAEEAGQPDGIGGTEFDAATKAWGSQWRLPTYAEVKELVYNCKFEETEVNGVAGVKITGPNGNSIFMPFAGEFKETYIGGWWSTSTISSFKSEGDGYYLQSYDLDYHEGTWGIASRVRGHSIRPVLNK